jgi:hypothetical protein
VAAVHDDLLVIVLLSASTIREVAVSQPADTLGVGLRTLATGRLAPDTVAVPSPKSPY